MSAAVQAPVITAVVDAVALAERLSQAMVRPDHVFTPFDAETRALSVGWIIGDKAIVALSGSSVQVIDAVGLKCNNDLGWMLLRQANVQTSPLYLSRMFGMSGPVDKLVIKAPDTSLQRCVILNRVIGPKVPHVMRMNYERDTTGTPIVFDTPEQSLQSEPSLAYRRIERAAVFRYCIRLEDGCVLE